MKIRSRRLRPAPERWRSRGPDGCDGGGRARGEPDVEPDGNSTGMVT